MEKEMLVDASKNLLLLLKLPEIKSDKLLTTTIEKALVISDRMYKEKINLTCFEQKLDFHQYRFWSGTLVSPVYEKDK